MIADALVDAIADVIADEKRRPLLPLAAVACRFVRRLLSRHVDATSSVAYVRMTLDDALTAHRAATRPSTDRAS
ncbi:hypothetical protein [Paraburkholderia solisilvae]|uniref:hypothetical protein n=1 Tax=Paraburkholderia solisilvae TaxID=624376 RepID=UPI001582B3A7|nr:hypothetical protein [Paraburkholderia solisilvae]